ncbi:DUF2785 domain-containing protein [Boudabousia marimammalium]|uniref:DUF2785 domain-containing protein n=1 Tax=Boudabousia marimammalium TaxID=156892 RepID=A0A1Q5PK32_9ACTO|nr:DUF2785 domain-containing protein [Boudabousia marimammalium]OKL46248.1 hypothetical protein BM477_07405 [Boudabousia marimammalium]
MRQTPDDMSWQKLCELMASPDPSIRDGYALEALAQGILSGRWSDELDDIQSVATSHLSHPEIQARTFAPLILIWLLQAGHVNREIYDECSKWYLRETDTRGYDPKLGWLHAVAHGADCLGVCAQTSAASGEEVLETLAKRVVTPGLPWLYNEPARVVAAVSRTLMANPDACLDSFFSIISKPSEPELTKHNMNMATAGWATNRRAVVALLYAAASIPVVVDEKPLLLPQSKIISSTCKGIFASDMPWLYKQ